MTTITCSSPNNNHGLDKSPWPHQTSHGPYGKVCFEPSNVASHESPGNAPFKLPFKLTQPTKTSLYFSNGESLFLCFHALQTLSETFVYGFAGDGEVLQDAEARESEAVEAEAAAFEGPVPRAFQIILFKVQQSGHLAQLAQAMLWLFMLFHGVAMQYLRVAQQSHVGSAVSGLEEKSLWCATDGTALGRGTGCKVLEKKTLEELRGTVLQEPKPEDPEADDAADADAADADGEESHGDEPVFADGTHALDTLSFDHGWFEDNLAGLLDAIFQNLQSQKRYLDRVDIPAACEEVRRDLDQRLRRHTNRKGEVQATSSPKSEKSNAECRLGII